MKSRALVRSEPMEVASPKVHQPMRNLRCRRCVEQHIFCQLTSNLASDYDVLRYFGAWPDTVWWMRQGDRLSWIAVVGGLAANCSGATLKWCGLAGLMWIKPARPHHSRTVTVTGMQPRSVGLQTFLIALGSRKLRTLEKCSDNRPPTGTFTWTLTPVEHLPADVYL